MTFQFLGSRHISLTAAAAALVVTTISGRSSADFGRQGTLVIGAERLFGIVGTDTDTDGADRDSTSVSFMWGGSPGERPYDRPRGSVDYFVIDNLSLGGSLGFYTWSSSVEDNNDDDGSGFLLAPRVGYMVGLTDRLGFWPRGGFTYVRDATDAAKHTAGALSLEAPLVIGLSGGVAITLSLTIDLGLAGEVDYDGPPPPPDVDEEHSQVGLQVGLAGFL